MNQSTPVTVVDGAFSKIYQAARTLRNYGMSDAADAIERQADSACGWPESESEDRQMSWLKLIATIGALIAFIALIAFFQLS